MTTRMKTPSQYIYALWLQCRVCYRRKWLMDLWQNNMISESYLLEEINSFCECGSSHWNLCFDLKENEKGQENAE